MRCGENPPGHGITRLVRSTGAGALCTRKDGCVWPGSGGRVLLQHGERGEEEAFLVCFSTVYISV